MEFREKLVGYLKKEIKEAGYTQEGLAECLNISYQVLKNRFYMKTVDVELFLKIVGVCAKEPEDPCEIYNNILAWPGKPYKERGNE